MTTTIPLLSTKGYHTLWDLSNRDPKAFYENPSASNLQQLIEQQITAKGEEPDTLWAGEITLEADLSHLNDDAPQDDTTDAANAPLIKATLPNISPAKAADHRLWASINCFALPAYTAKRWSNSIRAPNRTTEEHRIREWVQEHYLGHGAAMKQYNAAARLWWLSEMASRAAQYSKHSADRLLPAMANEVEMYHQFLDRPYLISNSRLTGLIYDMALDGNEYLLRRPYPNRMLQNLNIKAAAISLGTLSDTALKQVVEAAKPPKEIRETK